MPQISNAQQKAIDVLARDLDDIFGARLRSLVAYPGHHGDGSVHSCAIVDGLGFRDLVACLPQPGGWPQRGIALTLTLASAGLDGTIDACPVRHSAIPAHYQSRPAAAPVKGTSTL